MLAIAFSVACLLAVQQARRTNVNPNIILNLSLLVFIFGIIGARILYIVENISYYSRNPLEIIMLQHGGLSWFGGLILAMVAGSVYLKKNNLSIYKTFDLIVPFVALAQGMGRIGCLLNGCCFGKESLKFGLYFDVHKSILVPVQLYSSLVLMLIFIILRFLQDKLHPEGQIFFLYLLLYSIARFFMEFWRADHGVIFLGLSLFQIISIIIFVLSAIKLLKCKNIN